MKTVTQGGEDGQHLYATDTSNNLWYRSGNNTVDNSTEAWKKIKTNVHTAAVGGKGGEKLFIVNAMPR